MNEINLIGGFYKSKSLPFSAQDAVNWLPEQVQAQGARSPIKLRGLPGMASFGAAVPDSPLAPVLYRTSNTGGDVLAFNVPIPVGAQAGDLLFITSSAIRDFDPQNGQFLPDDGPYEQIGGFLDVATANNGAFLLFATADNVENGVPFSLVGEDLPEGGTDGLFLVYSVSPSLFRPGFDLELDVEVGSNVGFPPGTLQAPPFNTVYSSDTCLLISCAFLRSATVTEVTSYPLPDEQHEESYGSARVGLCYEVIPNDGTVETDAWGLSTSGSSVAACSVAAIRGYT